MGDLLDSAIYVQNHAVVAHVVLNIVVQAVYRVVAEAGKAAIELEHHGTVVLQDEIADVFGGVARPIDDAPSQPVLHSRLLVYRPQLGPVRGIGILDAPAVSEGDLLGIPEVVVFDVRDPPVQVLRQRPVVIVRVFHVGVHTVHEDSVGLGR